MKLGSRRLRVFMDKRELVVLEECQACQEWVVLLAQELVVCQPWEEVCPEWALELVPEEQVLEESHQA